MAYEFKTIDTQGYLHIALSGRLDKEVSEEMVDVFVELFSRSAHHKVLIDIRTLDVDMSVLYDYSQASYMASKLAGRKHRIACVSSEAQSESNKFFKDVGVNRGLLFRAFTDEQDAINWLDDARTT
jgi:hypothetical protein